MSGDERTKAERDRETRVDSDVTQAFSADAGVDEGLFEVHAAVTRSGPVTVDQFIVKLAESGLMPVAEVSAFRASLPADASQDGGSVARLLVDQNKLTRYQADVLSRGHSRGLVLGNYVVLEKLGEGGMGMVFKARHERMKRVVALKVLPPSATKSPDAVHRFHREVEAAARLQHPNIAAAHDADEADGLHFLVMEYVDGPSLTDYVRQTGPMRAGAAINLLLQAAGGLAHAHKLGIIHRDIKPSNLVINRSGELKVLDMGLARLSSAAEEKSELTKSGHVMGTVDYMAPEQALDAKRVDHRADIYSLGCTLYYLMSGKVAVPDGTLAQKLLWHQNEPLPPLTMAGVPPELNELYASMVAKDPADRPDSMREVIARLEQCLARCPAEDVQLVNLDVTLCSAEKPTAISSRAGRKTEVGRVTRTMLPRTPGASPVVRPARRATKFVVGAIAAVTVGAVALAIFGPGFRPDDDPAKNGNGAAVAETTSPAVPEAAGRNAGRTVETPPRSPFEPLLTWVFANSGSATLVTGDGTAIVARRLEEIPTAAFDVQSVSLEGTSVRDAELSRLADVPGLHLLSLADTSITDEGLRHVGGLGQLWSLNLSRTRITNDGLAHLARLPQLRDLDLQQTSVTDQGIARLAACLRLEKLFLSDTKIGDAGAGQLTALPGLRQLSMNGTYLTDDGYDALKTALPSLDIVWDGRDVERAVANKLLTSGATLSLVTRSGQATQGIKRKADLPRERFHLRSVDLGPSPEFGNEQLAMLAGLAEIESLGLAGTAVTSEGLQQLHGLASLKKIDLGSLTMTPTSIALLRQALPACEVLLAARKDRGVAEWALAGGATISVLTPDGEILPQIISADKLPQGDFTLRSIEPADAATITDDDLIPIGELAGLEALNLGGSAVTDAGVVHLASCTSLRDLTLSKTGVTTAGVAAIAGLPSLRSLYLAETRIDGGALKLLARASQLSRLSLADTAVPDAELVHLKRLEQLSWLSLSRTELTDASGEFLVALDRLRELHVDGTAITDAGLEELRSRMTACDVRGNPMDPQRLAARFVLELGGTVDIDSKPVPALKNLPRIACVVTAIDLNELSAANADEVAARIRNCPDLVKLSLRQLAIKNEHLAALTGMVHLKSLNLAETYITDDGLSHLVSLERLESLDCSSTRLNGSGLSKLTHLRNLATLNLGHTQVTDRTVHHLAEFPQLRSVDLSYDGLVTDAGFASLAPLVNLETLLLRGTRIGDPAMAVIGQFVELGTLDLDNTAITNAGAEHFRKLKKLNTLSLHRTRVGDSALAHLAELTELRRLNVSRTEVTEAAAKSFGEERPQLTVTWSAAPLRPDQNRRPDGDRQEPPR